MKHKIEKIMMLTLVFIFGLATSAFCLSYTTTAGDNSPYAGINFELTYNIITSGVHSGDYNAFLTITTPTSP